MLGQRIAETRKARGLSRAQLAALCGSSERTIANYENETRQPAPDVLNALCNALDVSADYLLGRTDAPQHINYAGIDPDRIAGVAGLCDLCFDLAAIDAAADYERDALPVYAEMLAALRTLANDIDAIYKDVREKYPAFNACSMTDSERAALAAAELSGDHVAIERATGRRAFDNKLRNRIEKAGNLIFSLMSVSLYNVMRSQIGADVPQLAHIIYTGGSSDK